MKKYAAAILAMGMLLLTACSEVPTIEAQVSTETASVSQVGLSYDPQATSCWDNPIIASSKSIYLERDITSRLSRYVREGMTAFCVWSEPLADGRYNIYIGYA